MKPLRLNKVIGLSVGEQSLLAAELAVPGADRPPEVRQLAEFRYPDGVTPAQPAVLGAALAAFLKERKFSARSAVVGLPAKWLIVKPKDVPPTDPATLADLLRLQAEGEFSSELRDLVYDFAADATGDGHPRSVLLIATPQRYVDGAVALCDAARLSAAVVTPTAVALGAVSATADERSPLVLSVGPTGAELTAQAGDAPAAIRTLRGAAGDKPFLGELRRSVSTLPAVNGTGHRMVLWGTDAEVAALNGDLGFPVRAGDLNNIGVTANGTAGGDARRFAPAVALALSAMTGRTTTVDFLHSRLAPPKARRVPRWVVGTAAAVLAVAGLAYLAIDRLDQAQLKLDRITADLASTEAAAATATDFAAKVAFARGWHGGTPRYLACLAELTSALPNDGRTYATNLSLREPPRPTGAAAIAAAAKAPPTEATALLGRLEGKTSDQARAYQTLDNIKRDLAFRNATLVGTQTGTGRNTEVTFQITFLFVPPKVKATPAAPPPPATTSPNR